MCLTNRATSRERQTLEKKKGKRRETAKESSLPCSEH